MFTPKLPQGGLTWKVVALIVLVVWLFVGLVVGERLNVGMVEMKGPGCSLNAQDVHRDVNGLPLNNKRNATDYIPTK